MIIRNSLIIVEKPGTSLEVRFSLKNYSLSIGICFGGKIRIHITNSKENTA